MNIKLSLRRMFFTLYVTSIASLLLLGSFALIFNNRLAQNQNYLVNVSIIEKARFMISNALSGLLARQGNLLTLHNANEIFDLTSRGTLTRQLQEGIKILETLSKTYPEIIKVLQPIKNSYQNFLIQDDALFSLVQASLVSGEQLKKRAIQIDEEVKVVRDASQSIVGILSLQNDRIVRSLDNELRSNGFNKSGRKEEIKKQISELINSNLASALRNSANANTDLVTLAVLTHQLTQESNTDILNDLRNNQVNNLIQVIRQELSALNQQTKTLPDVKATVDKINTQFNQIVNQLVDAPNNIYEMRKSYNEKERNLHQQMKAIQTELTQISKQFIILDTVVSKIRTALLSKAETLKVENRIITIGTVSAFLIAMFIFGYYLITAISKSLQLLISAMKRITEEEGGLQHRLEKSEYEDLNQVIDAFNKMATNLRYTQEHLQDLVDARTDELSKVNKNLEDLVTEFQKAKDIAESANRIKSEFVANMSHELRTPLNAIIGYSEMIREEMQDSQQTDYLVDLEKITASAKHLLTLINDVLDLSKIESGKMDVFLEEVYIEQVIKDLDAIIHPMIIKNNNTLKLALAANLGVMRTDLVRVRQCLLNLLSNASKFTKQGVITLTVEPLTKADIAYVKFSVSDTGEGIPPDKLERLFQAFSQADASTTRKHGGTGLGLYLTKRFADMLGGWVSVESEAGKGSTFILVLPVVSMIGTQKLEGGAVTNNNKVLPTPTQKTVLIIDDDKKVHADLEAILTKQGYYSLHAFNGEEGVKMAKEYHPDVITLDVVMPLMDGWGVLSALKANPETEAIPVILASLVSESDLGFSLGAIDFVNKPIDTRSLMGTIQRLLKSDDTSPTIMVVDDDPSARELLLKTLKRAGWQTVEASNGREAIEHLKGIRPSLILLDLMMPEMDGFAVIDAIQANEKWRSIPVVVVSAKELSNEERVMLTKYTSLVLKKGSYSRGDLLAAISEQVKMISNK